MKTVRMLLQSKPQLVVATTPDSHVYAALALMAARDVGALLVCDGGRLVGIVTERDVARKLALQGRAPDQTSVSAIMTERVICVGPAQTLDACMALMTERHVRHLPVIEGEAVIGMISIRDVVAELIAEKSFLIEQLESYIYTVPLYHSA
jgi:CBS domain-containing protein